MILKTEGTGKFTIIAFFMGLMSSLYVPTPVGFVAMLDGLAFAFAIPLFLMEYHTYPKYVKRLLLLAFLWMINGMISDWYREVPFKDAFKASAIVFNSWCLIVLAAWIYKKSPHSFIWFGIGGAISAVISLYKFQNGALLATAMMNGLTKMGDISDFLAEKQVVPLWTGMILAVVIMPLRLKFRVPWFFCVAAYAFAAFYMMVHGGSKSGFLISISGAIMIFLYAYMPQIYNSLWRNKFRTVILAVLAAFAFNFVYLEAAKAGLLGEEGYKKIERTKYKEGSMLDSRSDILVNWPFLWRSPIIGAGSQFYDRWGYVDKSPYINHYDMTGKFIPRERFPGHSCVVGAWTSAGIFGLLFWICVIGLKINLLGKRSYAFGDYGAFVAAGILGSSWHILFSPYGCRGGLLFGAVFAALAMEPEYLQWLKRGWSKKEFEDYSDPDKSVDELIYNVK